MTEVDVDRRDSLPRSSQSRLTRIVSLLLVALCLALAGLFLRDKRLHLMEIRELEARVTRAAAQEAGQQVLKEKLAQTNAQVAKLETLLELVSSPEVQRWRTLEGDPQLRVFVDPSRLRLAFLGPSRESGEHQRLRLLAEDQTGRRWSLGIWLGGSSTVLAPLDKLPVQVLVVNDVNPETGAAMLEGAELQPGSVLAKLAP